MPGGSSPQQSGNTTVTQNSAPWSGQQPYLSTLFQGAQSLYNQGGPQYFPGQTYAPETSQQSQAIDLQTGRALSGSPLMGAADQTYQNTINGSMLNANPYLDQTFNQAFGQLQSGVGGQFEGAGRFGSGAQAGALAQGGASLANQIYGGNYQSERARQLNAAATAPSLANQDYVDIGQLASAGGQQQQFGQNTINDQLARYNYNQQLPYNNIANFGKLIQGNYGQSQTTTQPFYNNSPGIGSILGTLGGGALGGYFGGPAGASVGAGVGGSIFR